MWVKYIFKKLPSNDSELEMLAQKLGVSLSETASSGGGRTATNTHEVQKRIMEFLRYRRESLTWLLALIAAISSMASAVAAWVAVSISN